MNYGDHYDRLMARGRQPRALGYSEKHHVVPRCLGGGDEKENIVILTPEEHYIAHQLLVKIHPGNFKLVWAASAMTGGNKKQAGRKNKLFGWLRRRFSDAIRVLATGRKMSPESRLKMRLAKLGKKRAPHSSETKLRMSKASRGKTKTESHCANMSKARTGISRGPHSLETRMKISNAQIGMSRGPASAESVEKTRAAVLEIWRKRRAGELPFPNHQKPKPTG